MTLVAKPERDKAKHRYKLIECMQVFKVFDRGSQSEAPIRSQKGGDRLELVW